MGFVRCSSKQMDDSRSKISRRKRHGYHQVRFANFTLQGSAGLSQAYIGKVTTNENRGNALSRQLEASSLGYAFGPGSGALLFYFIKFRIGMFEINPYTIPGYLSIILTLLFIFLILVFVEQPISQEEMRSTQIQNHPG